ncbi:MAG: S24/S26 family peptidase [Polyangiaceae bacterium]|nr:S24/S26 family peptidase [Polyangiaceae bacterium]
MSPLLKEGDCVFVNLTLTQPRIGAIVAFHDPEENTRVLMKSISSIGTGTFSVSSYQPQDARDSRHFGSVANNRCIGEVVGGFDRHGRFFELIDTSSELNSKQMTLTTEVQC